MNSTAAFEGLGDRINILRKSIFLYLLYVQQMSPVGNILQDAEECEQSV